MDRAAVAAALVALVVLAAVLLRRRRVRAPRRIDPGEIGLTAAAVVPGAQVGIVEFSTPRCATCRAWEEALAAEGLPFASVDLTARPDLAHRYRIAAAPLVLAVRIASGEVVASYAGEPDRTGLARLRALATGGEAPA